MGPFGVALHALLVVAAVPAGALRDGGFESGIDKPSSWRVVRRSGSSVARAATSEPHGGTKCAEIETRETGDEVALTQLIAVEPTKTYRLSFFAAGALDGAQFSAMAVFRGDEGKGRRSRDLAIMDHAGREWHKQTGYFLVPPGCREAQIVFALRQSAPGAGSIARLDDVELAPSGPPPPIRHSESAMGRPPSTREAARGFILFARHWLDLVFPDTEAGTGTNVDAGGIEEEPTLEVSAAPGEYEPVSFALRPLRALAMVSFRVATLVSDRGSIPMEKIRVSWVRTLDKRTAADGVEYYADYPVYLEEAAAESISSRQTRWVWVSVHVPRDTPPGRYTGPIEVLVDGSGTARLNLVVQVHPIELPRADPSFSITIDPDHEGATIEEFEAAFEDMREHGMTQGAIWFGPRVSEVDEKGGVVTISFDAASPYLRCMDAMKNAGFAASVLIGGDTAQAFAILQTTEPASNLRRVLLEKGNRGGVWKSWGSALPPFTPELKGLYARVVEEWQKEHARRGWPALWLDTRDEPFDDGPTLQQQAIDILTCLVPLKGLHTTVLGRYNAQQIARFGPLVDDIVMAGGTPSRSTVEELKKGGKGALIYNVDTRGVFPEVLRYAAGYYQWVNNLDGLAIWRYQGVFGDPYDDLDGTMGDQLYLYPARPGRTGGAALAWEAYREGIDDYRYLQALSTIVERCRTAPDSAKARKAAEISEQLDARLRSLVHIPDLRETAAQWEEVRVGDNGEKTCFGRLKLRNGWSYEDYDRMRAWVVEQILALGAGKSDGGGS